MKIEIDKLLLEELVNHCYAFSRLLEKYEGDKPSCKEAVRHIDVNASKAEKVLYENKD